MEVELKPLRLEKREGDSKGGTQQRFVRVLVIALLEDNRLYQAADIAALFFNPQHERDNYLALKDGLYNWAYSDGKNLPQNPDNIDPGTGRKRKGQPAKWYGKTWKAHITPASWNRAVDIFDSVVGMYEQDHSSGQTGVSYWWDDEQASVIRKDIASFSPSVPTSQQALLWRRSRVPLFCLLILIGMVWVYWNSFSLVTTQKRYVDTYESDKAISQYAQSSMLSKKSKTARLTDHPPFLGWSPPLRPTGKGGLFALMNRPPSP